MTELSAHDLVIGGLEPFSMVDWPGHLSATLFLQGCPWRCTYCHNPALQDPRAGGGVSWAAVAHILESRLGQLDAVVFSGGEPTRQAAIVPAMQQAREWGYHVGLHTAGAFPARLARVLPHVDWVGLDIKANPHEYGDITGVMASGEKAWQSLAMVQDAGVDYEVRITVDPTVHRRESILSLVDALAARGVDAPVLQEVRPDGAPTEFAERLAGRRLTDVVPAGDLPALQRR